MGVPARPPLAAGRSETERASERERESERESERERERERERVERKRYVEDAVQEKRTE